MGEIGSSNCGARHLQGLTAQDCARDCVDGGSSYILVSQGKVHTLANQDDKPLRAPTREGPRRWPATSRTTPSPRPISKALAANDVHSSDAIV